MLFRSAEARDLGRVEAAECLPERLALIEDHEPGQPGLIDLQDQALEQHLVVGDGEAVLGVVIGTMDGVPGSDPAIA